MQDVRGICSSLACGRSGRNKNPEFNDPCTLASLQTCIELGERSLPKLFIAKTSFWLQEIDETLIFSKMDSTKLMSLLDQLDDEMDDLEESLVPLIKTTLSETSSKLPLLDKAKLYVLVTYAIESMLFCK